VEYKFNVVSLDTEGASGDAVGLLLGSCQDELGASTDVVDLLEVGPLQTQKRAQDHHACTVPVRKRKHEDGYKEHATSLVLPSKQNLYNCICERQYPFSWHF